MAVTETFQKGQALPFAGGRLVAAPYQFVTTGEENIRVTSVNALAGVRLKIQGLRLSERGENVPFSHDHIPQNDRSVATTEFSLGYGALLHLTVFAVGAAPLHGQTFVIVQVIRGSAAAAVVLGTLLQGYVTSTQALGWPGSPISSSIEGAGAVRNIVGTMPALGAEVNEVVPTGARWELQALILGLLPGVVFAQRVPQLHVTTATVVVFRVASPAGVDAPNALSVSWSHGLGTSTAVVGATVAQSLPLSMPLLAGTFIRTVTLNLDPTDQITFVHYTVREWLEVP